MGMAIFPYMFIYRVTGIAYRLSVDHQWAVRQSSRAHLKPNGVGCGSLGQHLGKLQPTFKHGDKPPNLLMGVP